MAQYIDKDAVVAEINQRIEDYKSHKIDDSYYNGLIFALEDLRDDLINTLEVKNIRDIWHTLTETDLPNMGEVICVIKNGRIISGEYRANKFYGKVCNGYDNPIEKGDKWCHLSDIIFNTLEVKEMKEEPVSEDLEYASEKYACRFSSSKYGHDKVKDAFIAGAKWQKEQMMKDGIDVEVKVDAGGYPYIDRTIELYDYDKDVPLAKTGEKVKVIIMKEE